MKNGENDSATSDPMEPRVKLLLMPGMDGTGKMFRWLVDALPAQIEPIVASYPHDIPLTYDELFARQELPEGSFAILAESFSGPLAIRLAAKHRNRVQGLILVGSFACNPCPAPGMAASIVGPWIYAGGLVQRVLCRALTRDAAIRREAMTVLTGVALPVLASRARSVLRVDVLAELRKVTAPILYLQGRNDLVVRPRSAREIAAVRATQVATLDAGHLMLQERPQECARLIRQFLAA